MKSWNTTCTIWALGIVTVACSLAMAVEEVMMYKHICPDPCTGTIQCLKSTETANCAGTPKVCSCGPADTGS